jgi:hypothetical protein
VIPVTSAFFATYISILAAFDQIAYSKAPLFAEHIVTSGHRFSSAI